MDVSPEELDRLVLALCDDLITADEHRILQDKLLSDEDARMRYVKLMQLHNLLELEGQNDTSLGHAEVVPIELYLNKQRRSSVRWSLMAAAALLVGVAVMMRLVMGPEAPPLASVNFAPHSEYSVTHQAGSDDVPAANTMAPGSSLDLRQGTVELHLASGVHAVIQAPASLILEDQSHLKLREGTAWFNVPAGAVGFEVLTPQLRVVDLGTEFGVISNSDKNERDKVHVFKGKVEVTTLTGLKRSGIKRQEILTAGQAREAHFTGSLNSIPLSKLSFLTSLPISLPYLHWTWDHRENDHFQTTGNEPLAADIKSVAHSSRVKSVPGKHGQALSFIPGGGGVITTWPGIDSNRPRTITCWIKCGPHQPSGAIVGWGVHMARSSKWRVTLNAERHSEGGVQGALRTEFGCGYVIGSTDLRDDQWHYITSVYDGSGTGSEESIKLYVDGVLEPVSAYEENEIYTVLDDELSAPCAIGYDFNGVIDELRIYQGVLPVEAIHSLYTDWKTH